ncbi:hypothetical protein LTR94_028189 [Friedmanniomyces endolithicus]|nr:hypothetical protein LTR94_028189 [Friedmanniomyces endolithicus]
MAPRGTGMGRGDFPTQHPQSMEREIMVKVVGFPAPVGDTVPPLYGITVTAILLGQVKGQAASLGYLQNQHLPGECYAVDAELVIGRTAKTERREALTHGALVFDGENKPFLVIEQADPFPRLYLSMETGEAKTDGPAGMLRIYGNWVLRLEGEGKTLTELTLNG